jgi:hypothetical protein
MANVATLPNELLLRIIGFCGRKEIAQARLASKRLEQMCVEKLFEKVTLYAHWQGGDVYERSDHSDTFQDAPWDWGGEDEQRLEADAPAADDPAADDVRELEGLDSEEIGSEELNGEELDGLELAGEELDSDDLELIGGIPDVSEEYVHSAFLAEQDNETPQWVIDQIPGPPGYDSNSFKEILDHEKLKKYVKEVHIYTCETHCVSTAFSTYVTKLTCSQLESSPYDRI